MKYCDEKSLVILSGSIRSGADSNIYGEIINDIKSKGGRVILDADGDMLM